jgi:hypothetical protein
LNAVDLLCDLGREAIELRRALMSAGDHPNGGDRQRHGENDKRELVRR